MTRSRPMQDQFSDVDLKPHAFHPLEAISLDHPPEKRMAYALEAIAAALCRIDKRLEALALPNDKSLGGRS
jgi:hypothetical protein